jgi:hypothetical protein
VDIFTSRYIRYTYADVALALRDWREHPLIRLESVRRWMHSHKCKDSSKRQCLTSFGLFLGAVGVENPDSLIDEYVRDTRSDDPRVRALAQ